ncbi:transcriptional regulator [Cephaloticoccus primus]|uniref:Transcriptional regulator n=1 Tax=Cephaloticoccus primus TaxID=1548207 RepID=A0A139SJJ3_9BACT|nr:RNA-binding domain-containing protein [Cephaloticoccus primus]KXU34745.1 transcriptional regulator [Cephaloticoccus primus]
MTKTDLLELIANGENSAVEFKRDDVRPEQLAKEVVALANFQGGRILLGVDDNGAISGIQRTDLETWIMDTVFGRYVHPMILPFYEEIDMGGGKRVAVITLTMGTAKPYVLRHNDREDIYVRVGSVSKLASREQQLALFGSGKLLHIEALPVSGTSLADLDEARLTDYLRDIVGELQVPVSSEEWERRLTGLGFMIVQEGSSAALCTIAGLVLFGRAPRRALRHAGIRWMSFSSQEMEYQAQDDTVLGGPLAPLALGKAGARGKAEPGLAERLLERMLPFVSAEAADIDESLRRKRHYKFPLEAMREAIVNALVHRDWSRPSEIEVVNYANRLEVTSPGPLQNSMTVEKMLAGQRSPRNPIIVEVMRDYGYVDARGMGVRRKIVPLVKEFSGQDARFEATDDYLRVTLPTRKET